MSNVIEFIYLNPQIHVDCNLNTLESASNYYYINLNSSNIISGNVPRDFNQNIFLAGIGNNPDANKSIGLLNNYIFESMLLDGHTSNNIKQNGEYITSINKNIYLSSPNVFTTGSNFFLSDYGITSSNSLYILKDFTERFYVKINEVLNDTSFSISHYAELKQLTSEYKLMGILVYDPLRLATITYLLNSNASPIISVDPTFNPDLYKILYPSAKIYPNDFLYIDYLTNNTSNIGKTYEIGANNTITSCNLNIINDLTIHNTLRLDFANLKGYLQWDNLRVHGISQNSFTDSCNLDIVENYLITESAIKKYVDAKIINTKSYAYDINSNSASNYIHVKGKGKIQDYIEIGEKTTTIDSLGTLYSKNTVVNDLFKVVKSFKDISVIITFNENMYTVVVPPSLSYILNKFNNIIVEYEDFKNVYKISNKTILTNEIKLDCISYTNNSNIPLNTVVVVDIHVVNHITENIPNIDDKLYTIETDFENYFLNPDFSTNNSVVLTNNLDFNNSEFCYFLTKLDTGSNEFKSHSSNLIDVTKEYLINDVNYKHFTMKINSYDVINETTVVLTIVDPINPYNTYLSIYEFNFLVIYGKTWQIIEISNINSKNGSINIHIRTFDNSEIAYDSIIFGYLLRDITMISTTTNTGFYAFKMKDINTNNVVVDKVTTNTINIIGLNNDRNSYITYFDNTLYIDNILICSQSNLWVRTDLSVHQNKFNIKYDGKNVMLENNTTGKLYLGSSNAFIDNRGNMHLKGQLVAPEFSFLTSSNNVLIDLENRVQELEKIIHRYNLYL